MGILTALVPWPYRVLAMVLLVVACLGTAYVKGRIDEAESFDTKNAKALTAANKVLVRTEKQIVTVVQTSKVNEARIDAEADAAHQKAQEHHDDPTLPDRGCVVAPDRMRNILSAWGLPSGPGPAGVQGELPATAPAEKRGD